MFSCTDEDKEFFKRLKPEQSLCTREYKGFKYQCEHKRGGNEMEIETLPKYRHLFEVGVQYPQQPASIVGVKIVEVLHKL
jgi:hypothetical protein